MKKNKLLNVLRLILISSALFSCDQEPNVSNKVDAAFIRFSTSISGHTRGTPITSAQELTDMGVFCYYTGRNNWAEVHSSASPNKMENMKWTQNGEAWSSETAVNWGEDVSLNDLFTFFGYTPFASADNGLTVSNSTGTPTLTYTVPENMAKQPDLMVATVQNKHATGGAVELNYTHALACIAFKAVGTGETITAVKVKGVSASGTLSLDNSGGIVWSNLSEPGVIEYTAGLNQAGGVVTGETATNIVSTDGYLMMIPQVLTGSAQLIVTVNGSDKVFNLNEAEVTTWTAGERLTYTINTGSSTVIKDYTNLASSNCYIINPSVDHDVVYRIPIRRVNEIWGDASNTYGINDAGYVIGDSNDWEVSLQWSDKANMVQLGTTSTVGITLSKSTGVGTKGTADAGGDGWFELTVPQTMTTDKRGNFLVNVKKNSVILWSWHFWVTDYNPYATPAVAEYARITDGDNGEAWVWSVPGGNLFKLRDGSYSIGSNDAQYGISNPWAGLYANKKIMDRAIGASAPGSLGLAYQWGRNIPFGVEVTQSNHQTLYGYGTSTSMIYPSPNTAALDFAIKNPHMYWKAPIGINNYDWCTTTAVNDPASTKLWHDPKIAYGLGQKSVFDPSPYGFKLIENGALSAFMDNRSLIPNTSRDFNGVGYEYTRSTVPFTYSLKILIQQSGFWYGVWTSSPNPSGHGYATAFARGSVSLEDDKCKASQVFCVKE